MKNKTRTTVSGRKVKDYHKDFPMTITSQCPDKWLFVDLETGDVWHIRDNARPTDQGRYPFWRSANRKEIKDLRIVAAELD